MRSDGHGFRYAGERLPQAVRLQACVTRGMAPTSQSARIRPILLVKHCQSPPGLPSDGLDQNLDLALFWSDGFAPRGRSCHTGTCLESSGGDVASARPAFISDKIGMTSGAQMLSCCFRANVTRGTGVQIIQSPDRQQSFGPRGRSLDARLAYAASPRHAMSGSGAGTEQGIDNGCPP